MGPPQERRPEDDGQEDQPDRPDVAPPVGDEVDALRSLAHRIGGQLVGRPDFRTVPRYWALPEPPDMPGPAVVPGPPNEPGPTDLSDWERKNTTAASPSKV